jgi:hypothetical protein
VGRGFRNIQLMGSGEHQCQILYPLLCPWAMSIMNVVLNAWAWKPPSKHSPFQVATNVQSMAS